MIRSPGTTKLAALHAPAAPDWIGFSQNVRRFQIISQMFRKQWTAELRLLFENEENATFLNTGRGAQVVEADLIRALTEEPARTAVLDVTWPEPPLPESPLWSLQNVFLTPHIAGSMQRETARMGAFMEREFSLFLTGQPCPV